MSTSYHAKYFAHELLRHAPEAGVARLGSSLFNASIELTPHQIDAALFALRSPLSAGALLADEVGLGKTIEAGLVMCQYWAERKRRLLVLCPASLRTQWQDELLTKFNMPSVIIDGRAFNQAIRNGEANPFDGAEVVIASFSFAASRHESVVQIPWDLVVFDEAHKLRNCYRESNKTGQALLSATRGARKLLLTATPLQNSLLELYGLGQLLDEFIFGDRTHFQQAYMNSGGDIDALQNRLASFCHRTLRKDVLEYVPYTDRHPLLESFVPNPDEQHLYERVSEFFQRDDTYAIPKQVRHLHVLGGRKRLASSTSAIVGTLEALVARLKRMAQGLPAPEDELERLIEDLIDDESLDSEEAEELLVADTTEDHTHESELDRLTLSREIEELEQLTKLAKSIRVDAKSKALLKGLERGFAQMEQRNAPRKALIFTESRRTQDYLKHFLEQNGYLGKVILFNGTNSSPEARAAYETYVEKQQAAGKPLTSRTVDTRAALVDDFRHAREIMIATEAGAEGINLQFCALVINYDLPWNPQRIEQRIGRCHRYGQLHDVVVLNFLNSKNLADQRVYELLEAKFKLFDGVFGSSDEVLGALESNMDFEKRILEIYQRCRTTDEIENAFAELRASVDEQISARMLETREKLMHHFDEEVHQRLRLQLEDAKQLLGRIERQFWTVTELMLKDRAEFDTENYAFKLNSPPLESATTPAGVYRLISKESEVPNGEHLYRMSDNLGEWVLDQAKQADTPAAEVAFHVSNNPTRIVVVEELQGRSGWLRVDHLTIKGAQHEDHILFTGIDDQGNLVPDEVMRRLFDCRAAEVAATGLAIPDNVSSRLHGESAQHAEGTVEESTSRSLEFMHERFDVIDRWAEDQQAGLERRIDLKKNEMRQAFANSAKAKSVGEKEEWEESKTRLRKELQRLRKQRDDAFDEILDKSELLKDKLREAVKQSTSQQELFTIRWRVS